MCESADVKPLRIGNRPCRALVVDDNATNRMLLDVMLSESGAEVSQAVDGMEACCAFAGKAYDIVFMDLQMPRLDGLMAIRVIRALELERGLSRTPIIVVSANVAPHDVAASADAGADLHLSKPVQMAALLAAVQDALHGHLERYRGKLISSYA